MVTVKSMLSYCTLVWSVVYLATHEGEAVYTWGHRHQVILHRTKEGGYLPGWQAKMSGVVPRQQPVKWW
jgi:hypothetical protein